MTRFVIPPPEHAWVAVDVPKSCICLPLGAPEEPRQDCPIHGCICWDGNPDNYEGPQRDCPIHGEHASAPGFPDHVIDAAFGPDAIAHLRREAHQLRREADLIRADGAVDEAAVLEQEAAEIESRIDAAEAVSAP